MMGDAQVTHRGCDSHFKEALSLQAKELLDCWLEGA